MLTSPLNYVNVFHRTLEKSLSHCSGNFFLLCSSNFLFFNIILSYLSLSSGDNRNNLLLYPLSAWLSFPYQLRILIPLMIFAAVLGIPFNLSTSITRFQVLEFRHCRTAKESPLCGQNNEDPARTDPNYTIPFCHPLAFQHAYLLFAVC